MRLADVGTKLDEKENECANLRSELAASKQLNMNVSGNVQSNDDLEFALEEQKVMVQELEARLSTLKADLDKEREKSAQVESSRVQQVDALEARLAALQGEIDQLGILKESEIEKLR